MKLLKFLAVLGAVGLVVWAYANAPTPKGSSSGSARPSASRTPSAQTQHCRAAPKPSAAGAFTVCYAKFPNLWLKGANGKYFKMTIAGDGARGLVNKCKAKGAVWPTCGQGARG